MAKRLFLVLGTLWFGIEAMCGQALYGNSADVQPPQAADFRRVDAPAMIRDDQTALAYEALHFWDNFPFDNYTRYSDGAIKQAFVEFLMGVYVCHPQAQNQAMVAMMTKAASDIDCYWFFLEMAEEGLYDPNSPLRDDLLFEFVLRHATGPQSPLDSASQMRYHSLLPLVSRNQEGAQATDFVYTLPNGRQSTLYNIAADLTLIYFYNPGCPECAHVKNMLVESGYAEALHNIGLLRVLAIHPDEELDEWRATLGENPSWWISAYDKGAKILAGDLYDLKAIPTLYLLDGMKNVLLKDAPVEEVVSALSDIYNSLGN